MQRSPPIPFKTRIGAIACAMLTCAAGQAAELGDMTVRSAIGQPLAVDIELTALAPDEVNNLQVRLASPDVYRGANISMNPALQSLSMSVTRRDQRQYLHIISLRPINAGYVHLFLELIAGGRSMVRATTVWLAPDTAPPPAPAPAPLTAPQPAAEPADVSWPAGYPRPPVSAVPRPTAAAAQRHMSPPPERAAPAGHRVPVRKPDLLPAAVCARARRAEQGTQCVAQDQKNAALTAKLVELEGKIKVLQAELAPKPAPAPQAARPLVPVKPKLASRAVVAKPAAAIPSPIMMMLAGGAVLLLALAGLVYYLFRRRKKNPVEVPVAEAEVAPKIVPKVATKTPLKLVLVLQSAFARVAALLRKPFKRNQKVAPAPEPAAKK